MTAFDPEPHLKSALVIDNSEALSQFLNQIENEEALAVDVESAGFYKYYARINLIQIATRKIAAIVDPQAVKDFSPLRKFSENPERVWIFHGANYDASILWKDLDVKINTIFDTRIASELLGLRCLGLGALSQEFLGYPLDKKLQRCDWSRRPLTDAMKRYALLDAICLIPIKDALEMRLKEMDRLAWAIDEFGFEARECCKIHPRVDNPYPFLIKGSSGLSMKALAILREVWALREEIAKKIDRAPFMLMSNQALLEIAEKAPRTLAGISVIRSLNQDFLQKYGVDIQGAIKRGVEAGIPKIDRSRHHNRKKTILNSWEGEILKRLRDARNDRANEISLPASLLASPDAMESIAHIRPNSIEALTTMGALRPWQANLLAGRFVEIVNHSIPPASRRRKRNKKWGG